MNEKSSKSNNDMTFNEDADGNVHISDGIKKDSADVSKSENDSKTALNGAVSDSNVNMNNDSEKVNKPVRNDSNSANGHDSITADNESIETSNSNDENYETTANINKNNIDSNTNDSVVKDKYEWLYSFTEKLSHAGLIAISLACGVIVGFIVFVLASHPAEAVHAVSGFINENIFIFRIISGLLACVTGYYGVISFGMLGMVSDSPDNKIKQAWFTLMTMIWLCIWFVIPIMFILFAFTGWLWCIPTAIVAFIIFIIAPIIVGLFDRIKNKNTPIMRNNKII